MHTFTYKSKSTSEFGMRISGEATWGKPAPIYERVTVPGRNGEIIIPTGAYENTSVQYKCGITKDMDATYTEFVNFLLADPGYQKLEDSYHPDYYRLAMIESIGEPTFSRL